MEKKVVDEIKVFLTINSTVTVYDGLIDILAEQAKADLETGGVPFNPDDYTYKDYLMTYVRLRLKSEPNEQWRKSEEIRLESIYEKLYFRK